MSSWRNREAHQRALFRHVNERIAQLPDPFAAEGLASFLCECGNPDCRQPIQLTTAEYDDVRAHARRFAIALDHEDPEIEILVSENQHFAVVETLVGDSSRIPEETNPRAAGARHALQLATLRSVSDVLPDGA